MGGRGGMGLQPATQHSWHLLFVEVYVCRGGYIHNVRVAIAFLCLSGVRHCTLEEIACHRMCLCVAMCETVVLDTCSPTQTLGTSTTASPVDGCTSTTRTLVRVCLRRRRAQWPPTGRPGGG